MDLEKKVKSAKQDVLDVKDDLIEKQKVGSQY